MRAEQRAENRDASLRATRLPRLVALLAGACTWGLAHGFAQGLVNPDVNLFGDEIVKKLDNNARMGVIQIAGGDERGPKKADDAFGQTLLFYDGRQLRGHLESISSTEIEWRRPDISAPMKFSRGEVRRIFLKQPPPQQQGMFFMPGMGGVQSGAVEETSSGTVKLPGGDWLFGVVKSGDGQSFTMQIAENATFTIDRKFLSWVHFGSLAAPAYGFSGGSLDLEGWNANGAAPILEVDKGTATIKNSNWIGRTTSPLQQFELSFEVPEETESETRVWIQPIGPEINCYTTGTTVLNLGNKKFSHTFYANKMNNVATDVPDASRAQKGPARYRVLFDATSRIVVFRNGTQLGDWKLFDEKDPEAQAAKREVNITGICFERGRSEDQSLKLNRVRIQPWDGKLTQPPQQNGDCLLSGDGEAQVGKLGTITDHEITVTDQKRQRKTGMFLQFPNEPPPFSAADSLLSFGSNGEISASALVISGGQITCRTSFTDDLKVPMKELETISFPQNDAVADKGKSDVLVFKNGDEIPGQLVSADSDGGALRWRTASGQELEIQGGRVAGVRLLTLVGPDKLPKDAASVELRNGDRLHGDAQALDQQRLKFAHGLFGSRDIPREKIWMLHPNASLSSRDGGFLPDAWIAGGDPSVENGGADTRTKRAAPQWAYIDGTYILRPQASRRVFSSNGIGLLVPVPAKAERYEIRCDVTDAGGAMPGFTLQMHDSNQRASMQATFGYGRLQVYVYSNTQRGAPNWKQISYDSKLKDIYSRQSVRVFVDCVACSADFYMDGVPLGRVGLPKGDRVQGFGKRLRITSYGQNISPLIVSNLWVGPWNGDLPKPGAVEAGVALANGDFAPGEPGQIEGGIVQVASEFGAIDLAMNKITSLQFGGEMTPQRTAGRIRFADGSALNVDSFRYESGKLTAKSATLGDLEVPAGSVTEVAFSPAPLRPPHALSTKLAVGRESSDDKEEEGSK